MWGPTDTEARLEFNLGGKDTSTVYLDNIRVELIETGTALVLEEELVLEAEASDTGSGVNTEPCIEGGRNVGWWDPGDWIEYEVDVSLGGTYRVDVRYSAMQDGAVLEVIPGLGDAAMCRLPVTGDWQHWSTSSTEVGLPSGPQKVRLRCVSPGFNLNWIRLTRTGD